MEITVRCPKCSRELQAPEEALGEKGTCPSCGKKFVLQRASEAPAAGPKKVKKPNDPTKYPEYAAPAMPSWWRGVLYGVLLLALIPLLWETRHPLHRTFNDALDVSIANHPDVVPKLRDVYEQKKVIRNRDVFDVLPDHRLDGALLPYNTWRHWGYAGASAVVFLAFTGLMFGPRASSWKHLSLVTLFTATAGILFLFIVQLAAEWTQGYMMYGRGLMVALFYVAKFIGFSYRAALGDTGFMLSLFGFTFGVGLCEEIVKALPLVMLQSMCNDRPGWRGMVMWGIASGVGFGVSEGISYSSHFYNGFSPARDYVLRFVSCVALHATWTASVGIGLYLARQWKERRKVVKKGDDGRRVLLAFAIPIVLHGLYDTLLKKEMDTAALVVAGISFAWLAIQIEAAKARERRQPVTSTTVEPSNDPERTETAADSVSALTPAD
jgi:RsiW-degrading membrane proteinase PrsW (M82 family)